MVPPYGPGAEVRIDEPASRAHVPPQGPHGEPGHEEATEVELLGYGVGSVLAHDRGGKGQEGHAQQLQERQPHQAAVEAPHVVGERQRVPTEAVWWAELTC